MERKNINRGFKQLRVWNHAIELYVLSSRILVNLPFELKKSAGNSIDACLSISRNIAEGYGRKNIKEYLLFLNYSLGSSAEFHSSIHAFKEAGQISDDSFETLDSLHYLTENELIQLIKSLQNKLKKGDWENSFS